MGRGGDKRLFELNVFVAELGFMSEAVTATLGGSTRDFIKRMLYFVL